MGTLTVYAVTHADAERREEPRPLSACGLLDARWAGKHLRSIRPEARPTLIVSSPVPRCTQTAALVAEELGRANLPCIEADEICDKNPKDGLAGAGESRGVRPWSAFARALARVPQNASEILLCCHGDLASLFPGRIRGEFLARESS